MDRILSYLPEKVHVRFGWDSEPWCGTHSFDHVITCLVNICEHDMIQAEQCAYIANYKGRCDIKKGEYKYLKELKDALIGKGLIVSIE